MRNQNGITLITLIISIILLMIIATITVFNSVELYEQMKYETFKTQLKEMQAAVDKICEKYKTKGYTSYKDNTSGFFKVEYGSLPLSLSEASNVNEVKQIVQKYFGNNSDEHSGFVYYFTKDEINDYFGINGIEYNMVVDFSTRYVYAPKGCKNPVTDKTIYSILDYDPDFVVQSDSSKATSDSIGITFSTQEVATGNTKMQKVILYLKYGNTENIDYNIKKAYFSSDGGTSWNEVDILGDCKYTDDSVSFYIYKSGTYMFKIEDTSGKVITTVQGTENVAEITINL